MRTAAALSAALAMITLVSRRRGVQLSITAVAPRTVVEGAALGAAAWAVAVSMLPGLAAAPIAALATIVPFAVAHSRSERARRASAARWPDFLAVVRTRLAGGSSLSEACAAAARSLGGSFAHLDTMPGSAFSATLEGARSAWDDPIADRVLTTLRIANETGGTRVGTILGSLAESVTEETQLRRSHEASMTEQRLTAGVALLAPWVLLILSMSTNPTAREAFSTPTGTRIIIGGVVATTTGYVLARRSASLSQPPRVLA